MKVILIQDSNGHLYGVAHTPENVQKVKTAAIEAGYGDEGFENDLPAGRVFGNICEVIDTEKLDELPTWNPFM